MRSRDRGERRRAQALARSGAAGERRRPRRPARPASAGQQQPGDAVLDDRARAALGDRDDRQPAGLRLEQHLAEGVGPAGEQEQVGARVGVGERVALEPAEERRVLAEPLAQRVLLGAAAGEHEVQARVALARGEEGVGEQVGALLARSAARRRAR